MKPAIKTIALLAAIAASAATAMIMHKRAESRLQELQSQIDGQAMELKHQASECAALSNAVGAGASAHSLTGEKLSELLKLRNEIVQLRRTNAEIARMESKNRKLQAMIDSNSVQLAAAQSLPNYWPKSQLSYSGYADPSSATKSILAMMAKGDAENWKTACTPGAVAGLEREWAQRGLSPAQQAAEFKSMADGLMSSCDGFHIIDTSQPDADTAVVQLSFDGQGMTRKIVLKQIDNQWKMNDLGEGRPAAAATQ